MSLPPAKYSFTINQPATFYKLIEFDIEGSLYNFTGKNATFWLKTASEGSTLAKINSEESSELGSVTLGGVAGTVEIILNDTFISTATWTGATYELILFGEPRVDVIMRGGFKIIPF